MLPVTPFLLRHAAPMDVPALRSLIELSVRGLQKDDYSSAQIDGALGHAPGLDTQLIEDRTYFVAEAVGKVGLILGCGGLSTRTTLFGNDHGPNRANALLDPNTDPAKIRAIFVHPQWARKGLGTLILKHCEEAAQQAGFGTLEMGSTLTGMPLYARKGYVPRESVAVPLPNGETLPIVHMVKVLGALPASRR